MIKIDKAIISGIIATLLWSSFALVASSLKNFPPFLLLGLTFFIGSTFGLLNIKKSFPDFKNLLVGVSGIFLYHVLMFFAFRNAPALQVNLINYLWPALIVLFSPLVNKKLKLTNFHYLGIGVSLAGVSLLFGFDVFIHWNESLYGKSMALLAALTWSLYSVVLQRCKPMPVFANSGICLICGLLAFLFSYQTQEIWPDYIPWLSVLILGLGPMGLAFYAWDFAMRNGDSRFIGSISFLTPLLSNLWLVLFTHEIYLSNVFYSAILVIFGCVLVNGDSINRLLKKER